MTESKLFDLIYDSQLIKRYEKFKNLPGFVLLESSDKQRGRYDILSAYPYDKFKVAANSIKINNAFEQLERRLAITRSKIDLPFQGGAIGYFSYDFAAQLQGLTSPTLPYLTDVPLVDMGLYDWALIADHALKKVTLFAANTRPETRLIIEEVLTLWHSKSAELTGNFYLKTPFLPLISKSDYQDSFMAIYQDLQKGRAYQVNYTQPFKASYEGDSWEMYKHVRAQNPVPYSAFLSTDAAEVLCFSPERFLTLDKGLLLTSPIKGTEKRSSDFKEDKILSQTLLASIKNKAENVMIVDLLRNDLGKIAQVGSVKVRALCQIESYSAVHHLVSHIEARPQSNCTPLQAFAACFPGGSISGAPKLEAMHIITEREAYARGIYCGSIGYFSKHGHFDSNIAIRTLTATKQQLHLAAGGGIVIDSNWEDEYLECFTKITAILNGL